LVDADEAKGSHQVASGSEHVEGRANDLRPVHPALLKDFWAMIQEMIAANELPMLGGYGYYPVSGWVHVDTRPRPADGHIAHWSGV